MATETIFDRTPEGEAVRRFAIAGGGLTAQIIGWGAVLQDLRLEGHDAPLVLGFDDFVRYLAHPTYFGAIAGRYANRIRDGRFAIGGTRHAIDADHPEMHGLHGGSLGYARRNWDVSGFGDDFVSLMLNDRAGTMGFPGSVDVQCTYRLKPGGTFAVELTATTDEPTLCNLAHHSYFNLDDGGTGDILGHRLMLAADAYLPVDAELIPTGEVRPVVGTPFDFRLPRPIGGAQAYDNNFCLASMRGALRQAAWAQGATSGVEMEVWTTEPGVQFYSGQYLQSGLSGLDGRTYGPSSGFCLEPQIWPDSPNRPYFPQALLRPGEIYRQTTEYRFRQV
jgi:aldose 1-epimerase